MSSTVTTTTTTTTTAVTTAVSGCVYQPLLDFLGTKTPAQAAAALAQAPLYCTLKNSPSLPQLYSIRYDQLKTNFAPSSGSHCTAPVAMLCRGIFVEYVPERPQAWTVVCCAFAKFFNWGELAARGVSMDFDWSTATVANKEDGSIMKMYFYQGQWRVGSNNVPNAADGTVRDIGYGQTSMLDLFVECATNSNFPPEVWSSQLDPDYCYTFEMVSPKNQIVVKYDQSKLVYLGCRHVASGQEVDIYSPTHVGPSVTKAEVFAVTTLDECIDVAKTRPEGLVVRDGAFNRFKLKNPAYVQLHHDIAQKADKNPLSVPRVLGHLAAETLDDFVALYPADSATIDAIKAQLLTVEEKVQAVLKIHATASSYKKAYFTQRPAAKGTRPALTAEFVLMTEVYSWFERRRDDEAVDVTKKLCQLCARLGYVPVL